METGMADLEWIDHQDHLDHVSGYFSLRNLNRWECNDPQEVAVDNRVN